MAGITIVADVSEEPISADNVRSYARIDDGVDTTEITNMPFIHYCAWIYAYPVSLETKTTSI